MASLVDKAAVFAVKAHEGQVRKFSGTPYILHPMEVATIIATMTDDPEVIASGFLHDTVEDTAVTPEQIRETFGSRVYQLVLSETEDKLSDRPLEETWEERKRDSLLALQNTHSPDVKILWLADKLSNLRSFSREYLKEGPGIWEHLHQKDPGKQEWYYRSVLECVPEFKDTLVYREFENHMNLLFGGKPYGTGNNCNS